MILRLGERQTGRGKQLSIMASSLVAQLCISDDRRQSQGGSLNLGKAFDMALFMASATSV